MNDNGHFQSNLAPGQYLLENILRSNRPRDANAMEAKMPSQMDAALWCYRWDRWIGIGSSGGVRHNGDDFDNDRNEGDEDGEGDYRDFSMLWRAVAVSWHSGASTECARA